MAGDYTLFQRRYGNWSTTVEVLTIDTGKTSLITCRNANWQVYIQRVIFYPTVFAAVTMTFQDTNALPKKIGIISVPSSAPVSSTTINPMDVTRLNFGPNGVPLTLGKHLDVVFSGGGIAGQLHIEAFQRLGQTTAKEAGAAYQ